MGILDMLHIANEKDADGDLLASQQCLQILDQYSLCSFGIRLYHLYHASQRRQVNRDRDARIRENDTLQHIQENAIVEHARYRVQMLVRRIYMQHIISCEGDMQYEILPVLQSIASVLSQERVCEQGDVPGPSLTFRYSRKGDPLTMQQLYLAAK